MEFPFPKSRAFLEQALERREASGIALLVQKGALDHTLYLGYTAHAESDALREPITEHSLFDLASLTKILSTLCLVLIAESEDKLSLSDPIQKYYPKFSSSETTIRELLHHNSGLPAHLEFFKRYQAGDAALGDARAILPWICEVKLGEKKQVYSDLGFVLLGFLLEDLYGKNLAALFQEKIARKMHLKNTGYVALPHAPATLRLDGFLAPKNLFVATETCPWRKKTLQGEVHDDNTWAMGGVAGHAGLFSTLAETKLCLAHLARQLRANPEFLQRPTVPAGDFSYGLMTYPGLRPFPGPAFAHSFGHTGFVGTSAWLHPPTNTVVVLLANRVHPSREDTRWIQTRLEFHKVLWEELQ